VDDVDVGKPRLPWMAAGDGVGRRRSAAVVGRPGRGGDRGRGARHGTGGRGRGVRPWAAGRRRGGDVGPTACGRARARRRARVVKETERKKKGPRRWLFRITLVGLEARPTRVI
jgi:hypothetical protein